MDQTPFPSLPARPEHGHKGTFGTVCVIGGQCAGARMMIGGPAFSAGAALRIGCGLAVLAMPEPILASGLTITPSATGLALPVDEDGRPLPAEVAWILDRDADKFDCIAIGPGFGDDGPQQQIVVRLIAQDETPIVIDADALNAMARVRDFRGDFRAKAILTPHPGEFERLAAPLGIDFDPHDRAIRERAAAEMAQRLGCVVVLKGRATVVSDGLEVWVNDTGNVSLATAGTGDVLTGVIAGLVAQFFKPHVGIGSRQVPPERQGGLSLFDCARLGVRMHGIAADLWSAERQRTSAGLLASELAAYLPMARRSLETAGPARANSPR